MSPAKKTATKKATTRKTTRRKRGPAEPRGPEARASELDRADEHIVALTERVDKAKGSVLAAYRDPYAGLPLVLASLPIGTVEATPFQRDLSKTHADRLAPMAIARRSAWVFERSRWNGVASTVPIGSEARTSGRPA